MPLFIIVIVVLNFTGEGKVFFTQERIGRHRRVFRLIKFATMLENSPNMKNGTITIKNDPRILPFGQILRMYKINELPQLINVLKGEMSFVGPRPQTQRCFEAFAIKDQINIIKIRPGLTGIGSLVFRDEENMLIDRKNPNYFYDRVIMSYKGSLETWYIKNQNIRNYFILIALTIWSVILPNTKILFKVFPSIPSPRGELKRIFLK